MKKAPLLFWLASLLSPLFPHGLTPQLVSQNNTTLVFDFVLNDSLRQDTAGNNRLPLAQQDNQGNFFYTVFFALPPEAKITSLQRLSPAGGVRCEAGETGYIRSAYVAAFRLFPFSIRKGEPRLVRQGRFSVTFSAPLRKTVALRPDNPLAEKSLQSLLTNYTAALSLRSLPAMAPLSKTAGSALSASAKLKCFIDQEGLFAITYDQIAGLGFSPASIHPATFRLFSQDREIPILMECAVRERFSPGDRLLFYGTFEQGRGNTYYPEHTFSRAYYLDWGKANGLRVSVESGAPKYLDSRGQVKPFDPLVYSEEARDIRAVTSFRRSLHLEQDNLILRLSSPDQVRSSDDVLPENFESDLEDYWMWQQMDLSLNTLTFAIDGAPFQLGSARLTVRFMGYTSGTHRASLFLNGHPLKGDNDTNLVIWQGQSPASFVSQNKGDHQKWLLPGTNTLSVQLPIGDIVFLNWIEVDYDALPGPLSGRQQIISLDTVVVSTPGIYRTTLKNAPDPCEIWDIAGRRLTDVPRSGNDILFYDLLAKPATYCITSVIHSPRSLSVKCNGSGLTAAGNGGDLLILTPDSLRAELKDFVAWKQSLGLSVYVASLEAVYDEFGDGSVEPDALKAFVQYAYAHFSPSPFYLLLIGDTSEGSDKVAPSRNLLPAYFVQVNGWGIASADSRYTTVSGEDLFPDLSVGRLPVKNRTEMRILLKKIMDHERASDGGEWKNDFLLLGGAEATFTTANDYFGRYVLKDHFNLRRIDTDTASDYYLPNNENPTETKRLLNNGVAFVSFYGHGGGCVWSDGKPDLLGHDAARSLTNYRTLPIVYSLTCLTASFEAITFGLSYDLWPPLGETMLLSNKGGCAAFYGASGHSFLTSDFQLGKLLLDNSTDTTMTRVGQILFDAETRLLGSYGTSYFPIIGQYNLLGDPSMKTLQPVAMRVSALNPMLSPGDTLRLVIRTTSLTSGSGTVRIIDNGGALSFRHDFTFSGRRDTLRVPFPTGLRFPQGKARVLIWNGSKDEIGEADFTISEISFTRVTPFVVKITDAETTLVDSCVIGDTLGLSASLLIPSDVVMDSVRTAWQPDTLFADNEPLAFALAMSQITSGTPTTPALYRAAGSIPISGSLFSTVRGLAVSMTAFFHRQGSDPSPRTYTRFYHFKVLPPPDLAFPAKAHSIVIDGRPVLRSHFLNYGLSPVRHGFSIRQTVNGASLSSALPYLADLPCKIHDSVDIPIGTTGFFKSIVTLDDLDQVEESNEANNRSIAYFGVSGGELGRLDSVLTAPYPGLTVRAVHATDTFNLYLVMEEIDSLDINNQPLFSAQPKRPLSFLQSALAPQSTPVLARYEFIPLSDRPFSGDSVITLSYRYSPPPSPDTTLAPSDYLGFYQWDSTIHFWRFLPARVDTLDSTVTGIAGLSRPLMPGMKKDFTGPTLVASVNGHTLAYRDYIPLKTPIQIMVRDESGVDSHRIALHLKNGELLPRNRYSMGYVSASGDICITFQPFRDGVDSLYAVAWDINNNASDTARFGYQLGTQLSVKTFANHPNPFSRKTIFAFTLTDDADVDMRIYTLAGRQIRHFQLDNIVGYHEVLWNATDEAGHIISNGVYYLKLKVKNGDRTIEQIHKLAKTEGR